MQRRLIVPLFAQRIHWLSLVLFLSLATTLAALGNLVVGRTAYAAGPYVVNSTGDDGDLNPGDGLCESDTGGTCTLRAALQEANHAPYYEYPVSIHFNIPGSGPHTIQPATPLPGIIVPVVIDGTTQPGSSCWTDEQPAVLQIELDGSVAENNGLEISSIGNSTIRGLVINRFSVGIHLPYSSDNVIECNFIGTNAAGTTALPNTAAGVYIQQDSNHNRIGGSSLSQRNLISGNPSAISVIGFSEGATPSSNTIQNNYIGTDITGAAALGGNGDGIYLFQTDNNSVLNNVIVDMNNGLTVAGETTRPSSGTTIKGNYIGVNASATATLPNRGYGIWLLATNNEPSANTGTNIGGSEMGEGNMIAGNQGGGILVQADGTTITGNQIGTNPTNADLGNGNFGIRILAGQNSTVGVGSGPNVIAYNQGNGIQIDSGTGHSLRFNRIFANTGLGIDLGSDGVTLNHQGTISGPNNYQNYPVLTAATSMGESTRVQGFLESTPDTDFDIELYSNATCDGSAFGEGQTVLASFTVHTDPTTGKATFDETFPYPVPEPQGVVALAINTTTNNTSEFSYCRPIATPNLNWEAAFGLGGGTATQYITANYQEKWFKFPASPGAQVRVTLTSQPGSVVSLHRDPFFFYNELTVPTNAAALAAQAADTGFLPFQSLPFQSLPFQSLPFQSLPFQSLPTGFLPFQSLPFQSLPFQSLPFQSLPFQSLPFQSLPTGSLPFQSLPFQSLPFQSLPSDSLGDNIDSTAYSGAARRSLIRVAMDPNATVQTIDMNTYDLLEDLYVRVAGPKDLTAPFTLDVAVQGGVCEAIEAVPTNLAVINGANPTGTGRKTLILTDSSRLVGSTTEIQAALAKLQELADRTADVAGVVIDLADARYERVAWANTQADNTPTCPTAKNMVATEIKQVIDRYRTANQSTLDYVVLAGSAAVIPFFQIQDVAGLANEKEYVPPVKPSTPSEAGLKVGLVKGQDGYGSQTDLTFGSRAIAMPDLAVGRLVETANDIVTVVNAYLATNGVVTPNSALVTGYDFVGDAAVAIQSEVEAGTAAPADRLIQAPGLPPSDPTAWSAQDLRDKLLTGAHDLVILSGHFSAGDLLAADYSSSMSARELTAPAVDFTNVVVFALGCHGGFTIPSDDLLATASPDPDWAKAFLRKEVAGYVAATGYAYGDTELTEYGERLFVELTRQLRTGPGPIALGQALVAAKQRYLAQTAQLTGIDEKTVIEMTLYGLPMMKVDLPGERLDVPTDSSIVASAPVVTAGPGVDFGLRVGQPTIAPNLTEKTVSLLNREDHSTVQTTYLTGKDGVVTNPYEPLLPKELYNVSVSGAFLRGVALRSATYVDEAGIVPLTASPATETSQAHPAFKTDKFYPNQPWSTNFFGAIQGGPERLVAVPAQFQSTSPDAIDGTLRRYTTLDFNLYYLPSSWSTTPGSPTYQAAVAAAPTILSAAGAANGTTVTFTVQVQGETAAGIQAVWVLYTASSGPLYGQWQPLDLTRPDPTLAPTHWVGALALPGGATAESLQFMVQAVNGAGATTLATNQGNYYTIGGNTPPPTAETTTITLLSPPSSGVYQRDVSFGVRFTTTGGPVANQLVTLLIGGQGTQKLTNSNGEATFTLQPILAPGNYAVQASFRGDQNYRSATTSASFTVIKDEPSLTLTAAAGSVTALLRDSANRPLGLRSLVFVVTGNDQTLVRAVTADYWGTARLGAVDLPVGTYTVQAYFSGVIPLGNSQTANLTDDYYTAAQATTNLIVSAADTTPPLVTVSFPTPPSGQNGWFNAQDALTGVTGSVTADETTTGGSTVTTLTCSGATVGALTGQGTGQATAPITVNAEGSNTVSCGATDSTGNSGAAAGSPYTATILIDKSAPDTTIGSQPTNSTNSTTATFTFTGSDTGGAGLAGFACQLDGGAFAPCSSPQSYSALATGSHSFTVRAVDGAGNVDGTPATYMWVVQSVPNTLVGSCGGYTVYRTAQGQYVADGWSGTIKVGTNGNNTLMGTDGPDLLLGLGGNDLLNGKGGDDVLCGGDGVDLLQGHDGNDYLDGGSGNDVLNGGDGDYDQLIGGDGNDVLLDGDGVLIARGGAGNDTITIALRNGWRDPDGQARFTGLAAGYGNDTVGLVILDAERFLVDITGDERDTPASPLEGKNDTLALAGVIDPASTIVKFERQAILSAEAAQNIPSDDAGSEYLEEAVGEEDVPQELPTQIFMPLVLQ
ncbi:MAG: Ig-like domain repeat protein [Caldilineaceae bacterium]|nr:Ig-like domain repeat protein [Caldilineaceae bacterium]